MHGRASGYLDNDVLAQVDGLFTAMVRQIYNFLHPKSHYRIDKKDNTMHMLNSTTNLLTPWTGKQCHLGEEIIFESKLAMYIWCIGHQARSVALIQA